MSPPSRIIYTNGQYDYNPQMNEMSLKGLFCHIFENLLVVLEAIPKMTFLCEGRILKSDMNVDDANFAVEQTSRLGRLHIDDPMRVGWSFADSCSWSEENASPPPRDEGHPSLHTVGNVSDFFRRQKSASRCPPTSRLQCSDGSVSSVGSGPKNWFTLCFDAFAGRYSISMISSYS